MKDTVTSFSVKRPWVIMGLSILAVIGFAFQFPKVHFDNDPENMLSPDEPVRLYHGEVKKTFDLSDFVIVGIVNETDENGVFNVDTLGRIHRLTHELITLHETDEGKVAVRRSDADGNLTPHVPKLLPDDMQQRFLNTIFRHDPTDLFESDGSSVIIGAEIIGPSVVDNLKQASLGRLKNEYLMETAPKTEAEALAIRDDAMNNPLYKGTLVSENGKALALYVPIKEKHYAHNVSELVRELTKEWPKEDQIFITGLPVAEDTFGVQMLKQMATSAPFAGLIIFILLFIFFRKIQLIIAPMLVAIISIVCTMGLLIGFGHDVHIMSSMIAIFLMPIAVTDSVHMLSEFYDTYQKFQDKAKTIKHVVGHLFMPMLYTSLTTIAGFASLGLTPIPPVRVFGLHVAFGVGIAWLLTITFVPAYIMIFMSEKSLKSFGTAHSDDGHESGMLRILEKVGRFTYGQWKLILATTGIILVISAVGISKININDNPVKWFEPAHEIRVADRVLNKHFGGTYTAYLTLTPSDAKPMSCRERVEYYKNEIKEKLTPTLPDAATELTAYLNQTEQLFGSFASCDPEKCFVEFQALAQAIDTKTNVSWDALGDAVNYMEPEGLTHAKLVTELATTKDAKKADVDRFLKLIEPLNEATGDTLLDDAIAIWTDNSPPSALDFILERNTYLNFPFKRPATLAYVDRLQKHLATNKLVGKSSSLVDALKKGNYEINFDRSRGDANAAFFAIPKTARAAGQVFNQLEGMKKKDSLFHLVDKSYQKANVWVQLKSGDNQDMQKVVADVDIYVKENPLPDGMALKWAGLTYLNVVWQDKMTTGMLNSLGSSFIVVLLMMMILFRSPIYGLLSMIPLTVTITFIYGVIGWIGKDYDMPVAILSSLTLGLSVDFAIHFLERTRETVKKHGSWKAASGPMFGEPAAAITRNVIVIAIGFLPLLLAPLVPYQTVGFFLGTIMAVSGLGTLILLPALVTMLEKRLFKHDKIENEGDDS